MPGTLHAYWNDQFVGELSQEGARLTLRYDPGYCSSGNTLPLSRMLPLREAAFDDAATRAFFANLLPEGDVRRQVARQLGVSEENVFSLLEGVGGDCAGAISVLRPGEASAASAGYRRIAPEELFRELAGLPAHPLLAGEEGVRLSLAGAQNKLPLYVENGEFFIPEGRAASSHILKIPIERLENTVINEAFCMNLAQKVGLPAPRAEVIEVQGQQVYLVERYDRIRGISGIIERLHQEDFCQALGVLPEMKYEQEGGPGFKGCFDLVGEWSAEPILDSLNLLKWALFNFLVGNADAHAKNLSFLYQAGSVRLAPFYDLLSTAVYERLNNKFAMKMGGQKEPRYMMAGDLSRFAAEAGVGLRIVKVQLLELCDRLETEIKPLMGYYRETVRNAAIVNEIARVAEQRVGKARSIVA